MAVASVLKRIVLVTITIFIAGTLETSKNSREKKQSNHICFSFKSFSISAKVLTAVTSCPFFLQKLGERKKNC